MCVCVFYIIPGCYAPEIRTSHPVHIFRKKLWHMFQKTKSTIKNLWNLLILALVWALCIVSNFCDQWSLLSASWVPSMGLGTPTCAVWFTCITLFYHGCSYFMSIGLYVVVSSIRNPCHVSIWTACTKSMLPHSTHFIGKSVYNSIMFNINLTLPPRSYHRVISSSQMMLRKDILFCNYGYTV